MWYDNQTSPYAYEQLTIRLRAIGECEDQPAIVRIGLN